MRKERDDDLIANRAAEGVGEARDGASRPWRRRSRSAWRATGVAPIESGDRRAALQPNDPMPRDRAGVAIATMVSAVENIRTDADRWDRARGSGIGRSRRLGRRLALAVSELRVGEPRDSASRAETQPDTSAKRRPARRRARSYFTEMITVFSNASPMLSDDTFSTSATARWTMRRS